MLLEANDLADYNQVLALDPNQVDAYQQQTQCLSEI
jgi:hypothetical protein